MCIALLHHAPWATLRNINSELNSVCRSFSNVLTNYSSEILLTCVDERLDSCSVNIYLIGGFSVDFDKSLERKSFALLSHWHSLVVSNVPNFFKTLLAAKPMSAEELGKDEHFH